MNSITLRQTLPNVFCGMEHTEPLCSSQVWMQPSLILQRGNIYLMQAESGTGKSSLCSFVYGTRGDYQGTILFDDTDSRKLTVRQWCNMRTNVLAYLPQEMQLFGELTVMENIQMKNTLTHHRTTRWIHQALEQLEIDEKSDKKAAHLSVGQQQRVAIVRALCQPFDFLLLDEPVSHLDKRNNAAAASLILSAAQAQQAAIVATSVGNHITLPYTHHVQL